MERALNKSELDLSGKVALVTGGGAGIGRGIALRLAAAGASVAIVDNQPDRASEASTRARAHAPSLGIVADMMDSDAVRRAVSEVDEDFGRIDILVNNVGGVTARPFLEQSERSWRRHIDINLMSMLACTATVAPIMIREGRGGAIINVASSEASRAAPGYAVYAACKAAMVSFTKSMALELAEHAIRANVISPDHTLTPGAMGILSGTDESRALPPRHAEKQDAFARLIPLGREGLVEECGNAALFLASPLSSYITGTVLAVDGGTMAAGGWQRSREGGWTLADGF